MNFPRSPRVTIFYVSLALQSIQFDFLSTPIDHFGFLVVRWDLVFCSSKGAPALVLHSSRRISFCNLVLDIQGLLGAFGLRKTSKFFTRHSDPPRQPNFLRDLDFFTRHLTLSQSIRILSRYSFGFLQNSNFAYNALRFLSQWGHNAQRVKKHSQYFTQSNVNM